MHVTGSVQRRGRAGALLLAAHLVAIILLPLAHAGGILDRSPDHVEATGSHHGGHGDACVLCRLADLRFTGSSGVATVAAADLSNGPSTPGREADVPRRPPAPFAARGPPAARPAG
jgi:hypothetical protein